MNFEYAPEQVALRDAVRDLFAKQATPEQLREAWSSQTGRRPELWAGLTAIGVPGVLIGEPFGGFGGDLLDLVPVLGEVGRFCVPDAVLESCVLAPLLLAGSADEKLAHRWLPGLAAGELRATVALADTTYVPDAHLSDLLILERDGRLLLLEPGQVELRPVVSMDPSRRLFEVAGEGGTELTGPDVVAARAVGSAAVLMGVADRLVELAAGYATVRHQFGRSLGSFQAIKHQLAHALSLNVLAGRAVQAAAYRVAQRAPEAADVAAMARICAVEAEFESNRVALQVFGGVGFTWDNDLQMWLKRGKALELAHGGHPAGEASVNLV
jgi:alkylation response protein AidB-like acyl-CoA dehydrogenase